LKLKSWVSVAGDSDDDDDDDRGGRSTSLGGLWWPRRGLLPYGSSGTMAVLLGRLSYQFHGSRGPDMDVTDVVNVK
jgi:hypothetical protein